jgi:hypothetical protein
MKVLGGILKESKDYYLELERDIRKRLARLPKGSIKRRKIGGRVYYYLQERKGAKIEHKYIGKAKPKKLVEDIEERKALLKELKKLQKALKLLQRAKSKKHD